METRTKLRELFDKIQVGMELYYQRLVEHKHRTGGELAVWRDGKVVRIKP